MSLEPVEEILHVFGFLGKFCDLGVLAFNLLVSYKSHEAVITLYFCQHVFGGYPREQAHFSLEILVVHRFYKNLKFLGLN